MSVCLQRSALSDEDLRSEVTSLEQQGHRRLLVLTGEHPKYTFDQFLHAIDVISNVRSEPCGSIRRINVEIPSLSVSDMRRLKATDKVRDKAVIFYSFLPDVLILPLPLHRSGPSRSSRRHTIARPLPRCTSLAQRVTTTIAC